MKLHILEILLVGSGGHSAYSDLHKCNFVRRIKGDMFLGKSRLWTKTSALIVSALRLQRLSRGTYFWCEPLQTR